MGPNAAALVGELSWPFPDASIDRLLIVHGLEESPDPRRLMREAWRVLTDDGRVIIVAAHRRGLWSIVDSTPFAAGRPYLKSHLLRLLGEAMFSIDDAQFNAALFFPPVKSRFLLRSAGAWERAGARVWPGLSGVLMVEARKSLAAPGRAGAQRPRTPSPPGGCHRAPGGRPAEKALKQRAGLKPSNPGRYSQLTTIHQTTNGKSTPWPRQCPVPGSSISSPMCPALRRRPARKKVYKLSSNESALGASPAAMSAYEKAKDELFLYPDGGCTALRETIGGAYDLDPSRIVCGAGSDELLQLLTKAYAGPGDNIVQSDHGFLVYALAAMGNGAEVRFAPEKNLTCDIDAMLEQVDERTRVMFVANPNNPTGTYIPESELRRLRKKSA